MDGGNPFGYCGSNPVNDVDADGRRKSRMQVILLQISDFSSFSRDCLWTRYHRHHG